MVKKVGILFGMEDTFPWAFIDKVNELGKGKVVAEAVQIDKVQQGIDYGYNLRPNISRSSLLSCVFKKCIIDGYGSY